jgi:hypothetical protein
MNSPVDGEHRDLHANATLYLAQPNYRLVTLTKLKDIIKDMIMSLQVQARLQRRGDLHFNYSV